jgi:hypothetical protein
VKCVKIDVESAIPEGELADGLFSTFMKNDLAKKIIDQHRHRADEAASSVGGSVRTDRVPEFYIRRGSDLVEGGDFLLTASRWDVWVPDGFDPKRVDSASR